MGLVSRDLKGSQDRIRELEDQNQLLQTQLEAGKNFDSLSAEPLPGALASQGKPVPAGNVPPPTSFWPAGGGQAPAAPVMAPVQRPGMMDSQEFSLPDTGPKKPRFPWISSGSFAEAIVVEGADANASVTGDKNTAPMQLRLTGKVQMPNDEEFDLTGCFVTLEAWGMFPVNVPSFGPTQSAASWVMTTSTRKLPVMCPLWARTVSRAKWLCVMARSCCMRGRGLPDGIGKGIEKASSTTVGVGATASMSAGDIGQAGLGGGVSSAAKTLSDYYIKRAERTTGHSNRARAMKSRLFSRTASSSKHWRKRARKLLYVRNKINLLPHQRLLPCRVIRRTC
jgi:conjugal transfer pilus assembly protein TraB